jgi:hypothetical protein
MSARSPMARVDLPALNTPTTPVPPMPSCTAIPHARSRSTTMPAVRFSS